MWARHPRDPSAPQVTLKQPWSLSPDLPEGTASVHKTCRLDFLFFTFSCFFLLLILCIEFCMNIFLKCYQLFLLKKHLYNTHDRCLYKKVFIFVWIMGEERLETFTSQPITFMTWLCSPWKHDFLLIPFSVLHLAHSLNFKLLEIEFSFGEWP